MPRVKGLTSGSVPSFLDLILNFAESDTSSSLATQDTWLAQIKAHLHSPDEDEGRIVFYGDDTWLKLFPDFFARVDGTSSFFVSDFTEVDNNVTRHVPGELQQSDWNAMIMHYLGLDHIGHKSGPLSPNMLPKQQEMDDIVKTIYEAIDSLPHLEDTLLVLAGDHGMNSAGNHGGSAAGETSPALVFISPKLRKITCDGHVGELSDTEDDLDARLGLQPPLSAAALFALEQKQRLTKVDSDAAQGKAY
jgi:ethanolaminephosphotransferase